MTDRPAPTPTHLVNAARVAATPGLVAFWDFADHGTGTWDSQWDPSATDRSFGLRLRRIGDPQPYRIDGWPATMETPLRQTAEGPFGRAVHFDRGHLFAEVPRSAFDGTALDLRGTMPFTFLAWTAFTGERHLVAGVWDEGGWNRYGGRRQYALFGGLFGSSGVIAHLSATGAASFPQSSAPGAQYARIKAIDGQAFADRQWVCMAMTYDPLARQLRAWLDGVSTPSTHADPVQLDVFGNAAPTVANPVAFPWPVFAPRAFLFKFNGYTLAAEGVAEHALHVDLDRGTCTYRRQPATAPGDVQIHIDLRRGDASLLPAPVAWTAAHDATITVDGLSAARFGDQVVATLWQRLAEGSWQRIGTAVQRTLEEGAPFTLGRALGLGAEERSHGSQLAIGGVAVFNRVLDVTELRQLSCAS